MQKESVELTAHNLKKIYSTPSFSLRRKKQSEKCALAGISFSLTPGLYGLLGPNGAGKSTLINIITGNVRATSGRVAWNGENVVKLGILFRRVLGFMPQQQNLYDSFTGRQFLLYLISLKEIPAKEALDEMHRVAEIVHLTGELNKRLSAYSGGMKQRLLAAAAIVGNPQLLIMDEPTAGLDPKERVHLRETLALLAEERIVIVATHVVSDIESVAKEVLLLKEGVLVDKDTPSNLVERYAPNENLESVYLSIFGEDEI